MTETIAPARSTGRRPGVFRITPAQPLLWLAAIGPATQPGWNETYRAWLSAAEQTRLARFVRPERRAQFFAGHVLLRRLVADCLQVDGGEVHLGTRPDGSPVILTPAGVQCSLAHSAGWVAALVQAGDAPVGVDIEIMHTRRPIEAIVRAACAIEVTSREQGYLAWVRHEARLKAGSHAAAWLTTWNGNALAVCAARPPAVAVIDLDESARPGKLDLHWNDGRSLPAASRADGC